MDSVQLQVIIPKYIPTPKPIIDSQLVVCKGQTTLLHPSGGTLFNFYDTIPGIRPALAVKSPTLVTPKIYTTKTYYITDADSLIESVPQRVMITIDSVASSFAYTLSTLIPRTAIITSTSPGNSWVWNLADGNTVSGNNLTHTYSTSGLFPVTLILTDSIGCKDTLTQSVNIPPYTPAPKPIIDSLIIVCKGQNYVLQPTGGTLFNFYDTIPGTASALLSKVPTFTTSGITSSVTYYITDADSLFEGPWSKVVVSYSHVTASFGYAISQAAPLTVDFSSTTPGAAFRWELGNGNTASGSNLTYTYDSTGTYVVRLNSTDNYGCSDSIQHPVIVPLTTDINDSFIGENIKILPNPASDFIMIQTKGFTAYKVDARLVNSIGQIVYVAKIQLTDQSPISISVSSFASGVYTLILQNGASTIVRKISIFQFSITIHLNENDQSHCTNYR
jgi:PKD repeat protein